MAALKLQASNGKSLRALLINETDYCSIFLETKDESIRLGDDSFKQIRSQMMSNLRPPYDTKKGVRNGKEIEAFWVMSLMGPHATIHGSPIKKDANESDSDAIQGVNLYWEKADGTYHYIMKLSKEDIQSWLKILEKTEQLPEKE